MHGRRERPPGRHVVRSGARAQRLEAGRLIAGDHVGAVQTVWGLEEARGVLGRSQNGAPCYRVSVRSFWRFQMVRTALHFGAARPS